MQDWIIFDVDNTLLRGQSQQTLLLFLFKSKQVGLLFFLKVNLWFLLYKLGFVDPRKLMQTVFLFLNDKNIEDVQERIHLFFNEVLRFRFFPEALKLLQCYKEKGFHILLVSNAIEPIIKEVADFLAIKSYLATTLQMSNSKYTGLVMKAMYGAERAKSTESYAAEHSLNLKKAFFYTDHESDLPLLEKVGHPIAVNPTTKLRRIALKRNWEILKFN